MSKYEIRDVNDFDIWDALVRDSECGTIFSSHHYLQAVDRKYRLFFIYKGSEIKAGVSLMLSEDEKSCELDDLVIYNGILFQNDSTKKEIKSRLERFDITSFAIEEFERKYNRITMRLSPPFEDMRPFLWHNYHSSNPLDKFKIDLRYTSCVNISSLVRDQQEEETVLFQSMETLRQRNIREARKDGAIVKEENQVSLFIAFYRDLMFQQNETVQQSKLDRMRSLIETLLKEKLAIMTVSFNSSGGILYATIYGLDNKRAYYLFGAGNLNAEERYKGTITFWDSFKILSKKYGIKEIDMEGVNSPKRGWFKLSFGGDIRPYFLVDRRRDNSAKC